MTKHTYYCGIFYPGRSLVGTNVEHDAIHHSRLQEILAKIHKYPITYNHAATHEVFNTARSHLPGDIITAFYSAGSDAENAHKRPLTHIDSVWVDCRQNLWVCFRLSRFYQKTTCHLIEENLFRGLSLSASHNAKRSDPIEITICDVPNFDDCYIYLSTDNYKLVQAYKGKTMNNRQHPLPEYPTRTPRLIRMSSADQQSAGDSPDELTMYSKEKVRELIREQVEGRTKAEKTAEDLELKLKEAVAEKEKALEAAKKANMHLEQQNAIHLNSIKANVKSLQQYNADIDADEVQKALAGNDKNTMMYHMDRVITAYSKALNQRAEPTLMHPLEERRGGGAAAPKRKRDDYMPEDELTNKVDATTNMLLDSVWNS